MSSNKSVKPTKVHYIYYKYVDSFNNKTVEGWIGPYGNKPSKNMLDRCQSGVSSFGGTAVIVTYNLS